MLKINCSYSMLYSRSQLFIQRSFIFYRCLLFSNSSHYPKLTSVVICIFQVKQVKMKKAPSKRSGPGSPRGLDLKKPFGFCCDSKNQDAKTRYNENNPPFKSTLTNIFLNGGGPDLKFRIQDVGKLCYLIRREGGRRIMSGTSLGECNRCRGPLKWYLEDEISLARDMLALDKQTKYNLDAKKHVNMAIKKARKQRKRRTEEKQKRHR